MKTAELGFKFNAPVDPLNPLDPNDPPPKRWKSVDHDAEYHRDRCRWKEGPSDDYLECVAWDERERERYRLREPPKAA